MKNLTTAQIHDIPRLKAEGYTTKGIAKLYNVHQTAINYWYRRIEQATGLKLPKDPIGRPQKRIDLAYIDDMVKEGEVKRQREAEDDVIGHSTLYSLHNDGI